MGIKEITLEELKPREFIERSIRDISDTVGSGTAVNALSGGVDSSVVTMLGHKALGSRLKTYFIENGLMREGEPEYVVSLFNSLGVPVEMVDARDRFFGALKGIKDPEEKREAITQTFYKDVFGRLVRESGANFLLQGTNYTDVEETIAGVKRQHNILEQLGIDTQESFGYKVIEPVVQLRKPAVRKIAEGLGLPKEVYDRPPFPGPALAARVIGEVTPERIGIVRQATKIADDYLYEIGAFQYMAILHEDKVTGVRDGKRDYGLQVEIRSWDSKDAQTASPTKIPYGILFSLADKITAEVPGVVSVTYNITSKPPSTMEAV